MIVLQQVAIGFIFSALAFIFASFVEYWVHRYMHYAPQSKLGKRHLEHHRKNTGQGFWEEFKDYLKGSWILMLILLPFSRLLGLSWLAGGLAYTIFAAYAHQMQHENPSKCFWMKMPVHHVHHEYNQWHHNFGLGVDWWDWIFGTYQAIEWQNSQINPLNLTSTKN